MVVPLESFFLAVSTVALPVGAVFFVFIINFVSFLDTLVLFRILLQHRDILVHTGLSDCFPGLHDLFHAYLTFFASRIRTVGLWFMVSSEGG